MQVWMYRPSNNDQYNKTPPIDLNYVYTLKGRPYYFEMELRRLEAEIERRKKEVKNNR